MNNQFVTYEIALELEKLGFDEECFKVYDPVGYLQDEKIMDELSLEKIKAPLWQQVFDWFREKHGMYIWIEPVVVEQAKSHIKFEYFILFDDIDKDGIKNDCLPFHTYHIAREQAILKCIELCQKEK